MAGGRPGTCAECGSPLGDGQRYCLACGARAGAADAHLDELKRRMLARSASEAEAADAALGVGSAAGGVGSAGGAGVGGGATGGAPAGGGPAGPGAPRRWTLPVWKLPSRPVSAGLVLVFLGFGVLLGNVASSGAGDSLASSRTPLKVVVPDTASTAPATSTTATTGDEASPGGGESGSEPPASEPEPTPAATKASTTKSSGKSSTSTSESANTTEGSEEASSESSGSSAKAFEEPAKKLPPIKHVWLIVLSDEPYASVFGPASTAPYVTGTLEKKGELLVRYDAVAHEGLADEIALVSGQGPTVETAADCPNYTEITATGTGPDEQVLGSGCVYPSSTRTLPGELQAKGLTWRAYVQGIDEAGATATACAHPTLGQPDPTSAAGAQGTYLTDRNPFVYLGSIVSAPACAQDDVGLAALKGDLASVKSTPSFSYIAPDACDDGSPTACAAGAKDGMTAANSFLQEVVGEITASKAYKENGLLAITVDQAPATGEFADSSSCCGEPLFPNDPVKTLVGAPRGGGAVGALLLSPYIKGATTSQEAFNHFSLLATIEDLFGVAKLGYAALPAVKAFEPAMFQAGKA